MTHASLFTGIGGFDLAAEMMGWTNLFQCEWDPFCQEVLRYRFPYTAKYHDIHDFRGRKWQGAVDVLSGGFPCQPYSNAGKRMGKADDRHLWPQMLRAIREVRPRYVVGENVAGLLTWNGGVVIEEVLSDLEAEGYRTLPPVVLPAAGKGAPHRRDRVWIIAHTDSGNAERRQVERSGIREQETSKGPNHHAGGSGQRRASSDAAAHGVSAYADLHGRHRSNGQHAEHAGGAGVDAQRDPEQGAGHGHPAYSASKSEREPANQVDAFAESRNARAEPRGGGERDDATNPGGKQSKRRGGSGDVARPSGGVEGEAREREWSGHSTFHRRAGCDWSDWPTQPPLCNGDDGLSSGLVRYSPGEADALRKQALHAGGNAIVPQIAYEIFQAIQLCEQ